MSILRIAVAVLALAGFGGWLPGNDPRKGDAKPDPAKAKRQLPAGWAMLNLSDAQVKQIHSVQDDYGPKIAALKKQLDDLQKEERAKMYEVLTAEQKKQLKDLRDIKDSGDDKKADKKDEKKP
jgi:Spy/CpxP family protein refolding chaperone